MFEGGSLRWSRVRLVVVSLCAWAVACVPDWKEGTPNEPSPRDPRANSGRDAGGRDSGRGKQSSEDGPGGGSSEGQSGPCKAGTLRCDDLGTSVEVCTAQAGWTVQELCDSACTEGACAGACKPGSKHCGPEQTPETCNAEGAWEAKQPCEFACTGKGVCGGSCRPGEKRCNVKSAKVPEECDETGTWAPGEACKSVCIDGECGGSCTPGEKRCGPNNTPDLCNKMGIWEPQEACPFVCTGEGECTGTCVPGSRSCDGQTPQLCDQMGNLKPGNTCNNSTCSMGMCVGQCEPEQGRCGPNETPEKCNDKGMFEPGKPCEYVCTGDGMCTGQCVPNSKMCSGPSLRTCKADGSGFDVQKCSVVERENETPTCLEGSRCGSACMAPQFTCLGSSYCWTHTGGCDACAGIYKPRAYPGVIGGDRICVADPVASRARMQQEDAASAQYAFGGLPGTCDVATSYYRNAFVGDLTCLPLGAHNVAADESAAHASHTIVGQGPP